MMSSNNWGTDGKITVNTSNQPTTTEQEKVDYIHATGAKADKDSPTRTKGVMI